MTALRKYQRLESPGLWREHPEAQRREVIVGLREATIVLSDPKTEMALSQWSLPALERINPDITPAIYSPGPDAPEILEVDDRDMIAALDLVHRALERRKPHPGRLRTSVLGVAALAVVGVVVFWLPGKLVDQTAAVLPAPTREDLGSFALADLGRLTGSPCKSVAGRSAATDLARRLFPDAPPRIEVLRSGLTGPMTLPGNLLLLPQALVESADGPEALAGYILAETEQAKHTDAVIPLLDYMGLAATLRLLTTGSPGADAVTGYAETALANTVKTAITTEALLARFSSAEVSSAPYAYSLDRTGTTTQDLIDADPFPKGTPTRVLTDETWLQLQSICTE